MKNITTSLLSIKTLEQAIKERLLKQNISSTDISYMKDCSLEMIRLTNQENAESYIFLGKANLLDHQYADAKKCFQKASELDETLASSYYGLFKVAITEKDYESALLYIDKFTHYSGIDMSIYVSLIKRLKNDNSGKIKETNDILGNKNLYKPLMHNYKLMIACINNNDYNSALRHLQVCIKLIKIKGYHIDLSYIDILLTKLKQQDYTIKLNGDIKDIKHMIETTSNLGYLYLLLNKLYKLEPNNIDNLYLLIEISLAFEDIDQARKYTEQAKKIKPNSKRLENFQAILGEKKSNVEDFILIAQYKESIATLVSSKKYSEAIQCCHEYYMQTDCSYFLYMIGVILFTINEFSEAKRYFDNYLSLGYHSELKQTYYYLFYTSYYLGEKDFASYGIKALELSGFEGTEISTNSFIQKLLQIDEFDESHIRLIEKSLFVGNTNINIQKKFIYKQEIV